MTPLEITLIVLLSITLIVLGYFAVTHFIKAKKSEKIEETMETIPYKATFEDEKPRDIPPQVATYNSKSVDKESQPMPIRENIIEEKKAPEIPGTTPEEVAEPEPLQRPVSQKVDPPSSYDKYEKNENQALFGANLRHPEAMITKTDNYASLETDVASGIANQVKNQVAVPTEFPKSQFNQEMVNNGGEFMEGINAFDTSDSKTWFSNL
jgi:hypothetical protein